MSLKDIVLSLKKTRVKKHVYLLCKTGFKNQKVTHLPESVYRMLLVEYVRNWCHWLPQNRSLGDLKEGVRRRISSFAFKILNV